MGSIRKYICQQHNRNELPNPHNKAEIPVLPQLYQLTSTDGQFLQYDSRIGTARKAIFSFSKCSEKMVFPKKSHWNMSFLYYQERSSFSKNAWKYDVFFKCSEKMVFPKNSHWNIFLVISGNMVCLFLR